MHVRLDVVVSHIYVFTMIHTGILRNFHQKLVLEVADTAAATTPELLLSWLEAVGGLQTSPSTRHYLDPKRYVSIIAF